MDPINQSAPEKTCVYGNPLGRGERWVRFDVNALSLALSLSLSISLSLSGLSPSGQPLGQGERLVCFGVNALSLSLSLSFSRSLSRSLSLLSLSLSIATE